MTSQHPVLVLISTDPRVSHRAFEALRIGTGVLAGENEVAFVLTGAAVHLLDEDTDELVDGDDVARFRETLRSLGAVFHVEEAALPADPGWNSAKHPVVSVSRDGIAELVRGAGRALIF